MGYNGKKIGLEISSHRLNRTIVDKVRGSEGNKFDQAIGLSEGSPRAGSGAIPPPDAGEGFKNFRINNR